MKQLLPLLFVTASICVEAQQQVLLQIDHWLGSTPYSHGTAGTNNNGEAFDAMRLEYYLSEIALIHDGGQVSPVTGTWVLADAGMTTTVDLGSHPITQLEAVRFGVGVDASVNHADPATYPSGHPLAPQSPSMHWGWTAGYRFVAMEGSSGAGLLQNYEIHALGDANYFIQTIPTQGVDQAGELLVKLNADYEEAMHAINVAGGPIVHGETGIARDLLENFRDRVFTSVEGNGSVGVPSLDDGGLVIFPNPTDGAVRVSVRGSDRADQVRVHDALGRVVMEVPFLTLEDLTIELPAPGTYHISVLQAGIPLARRSVIKH